MLLSGIAGCASTTAPGGYLDRPDEAQRQAYGGWATVDYALPDSVWVLARSRNMTLHGELIAIDADSLFLLQPARDTLIVIGRSRISNVKLTGYSAEKGRLAAWTVVGSVSTLSHGGFLILSAPLWIISGSLMTGSYSRIAELNYPTTKTGKPAAGTVPPAEPPGSGWDRLRLFARFPQGMPPNLDPRSLQARHQVRRSFSRR